MRDARVGSEESELVEHADVGLAEAFADQRDLAEILGGVRVDADAARFRLHADLAE